MLLSVLLSATFAINMDCEIDLNINRCDVSKDFKVTEPGEVVTTINGLGSSYYHSLEIKLLLISAKKMHYLPQGIEKLLPNIKLITISGTKLKSINNTDLRPFTELEILNVQYNDIESLDNELFIYNPNIKRVNINNNEKLQVIGKDILKPLRKLENAYFPRNKCIDTFYDRNVQGSITLKELETEIGTKCIPSTDTSTFKKLKTWVSDLFR